ncbi:MAG: protein translocase subunit SecD [Acidimicrobiia bacterium]|nr:protein translocase subunit SecD [Acidimicrobiia bacterium]
MRRPGLSTLVAFTGLTVAMLVGVLAVGWKPLLGLDLQGGISVVLRPRPGTESQDLGDRIDQAMAIIRNRVDALGVAEPDINRQGDTIVVQLPGVKDQQRVLELVGTTAELRFRPVVGVVPSPSAAGEEGTTTTAPGETTTTAPGATTTAPGATTTAPGEPTTTTAPGATGTTATTAGGETTTTAAPTSTSESGFGAAGPGEVALGPTEAAQDTTTTTAAPPSTTATTPAPDATTTTTAAGTEGATTTTAATTDTTAPTDPLAITPRDQDLADREVVLPSYEGEGSDRVETFRYLLGPSLVSGQALSDARATLTQNGQWIVLITFKDGEENVGAWRSAASTCLAQAQACPTGQLAVALDGEVLSAPTVQSDFQGVNEATISGDFGEREARDLATALRYGSLPIELEQQQSQEVSATVGNDALRAGVIAGIIGILLVTLYLILYYKLLGVVAIASLATSFALLWAVVAWLGETQGLALTLAGVVGIIMSIGVSVDSNIVYFETIKDDMLTGRNLRSSSERAFRGALSTIIKADSVSLIGAALLYWLTVGPVRGFAFYLGLSTVLDLFATWFFMRPAVKFLASTDLAQRRPHLFGIPKGRSGSPPTSPVPSTPVAV